jgi:glycosyltransferase involved in cell wall biosynthesis
MNDSVRKIIVVIPAYNEEKTIREVIRRMPDLISRGIQLTPLVVDDGSQDHTAEYALACGAVVISHTTNQGVGKSFHDGLQYALDKNVDVLVNIDADLQYDPSDIVKLIQPILEGKADFQIMNLRQVSLFQIYSFQTRSLIYLTDRSIQLAEYERTSGLHYRPNLICKVL